MSGRPAPRFGEHVVLHVDPIRPAAETSHAHGGVGDKPLPSGPEGSQQADTGITTPASASSFTSSSWRDVAVKAAKRFGAKYVMDGVFSRPQTNRVSAGPTLTHGATLRSRGEQDNVPQSGPSGGPREEDAALIDWCGVLTGESPSSSRVSTPQPQGGSELPQEQQQQEQEQEEVDRIARLLTRSPGVGIALPQATEPVNPTTRRRLVYFSADAPPVAVIAEPHRRFIGVSFYKIKKSTHSRARGAGGDGGSGGATAAAGERDSDKEPAAAFSSSNISPSSPVTAGDSLYDRYVYRFSPFFFGTVLGYSDDNESIVWQERTQRFATRFRLQDVRYLIRASVMRCRHCGQVQLASELSAHLETHIHHVALAQTEEEEEEWAGDPDHNVTTEGLPRVEEQSADGGSDLESQTPPTSSPRRRRRRGTSYEGGELYCGEPIWGQACGDTSLLERMQRVRRLGEGAQGVVDLYEVPTGVAGPRVMQSSLVSTPPPLPSLPLSHEPAAETGEKAAAEEKEEKEEVEEETEPVTLVHGRTATQQENQDAKPEPEGGVEEEEEGHQSCGHQSTASPQEDKENKEEVDKEGGRSPLTRKRVTEEGNDTGLANSMQIVVKTCEFDAFPDAVDHYQKSVRFMSNLPHAAQHHLVPYYAVQLLPDGHTVRVIMPYYPEGDVSQFIAESDGTPVEEAMLVQMGLQMCDALRYLHERNPPIVHGDITPSNVMFDQNHTSLVLMDLDASTEWMGGGGRRSTINRRAGNSLGQSGGGGGELGGGGAALGTSAYMSPETMESGCRMPASDMWSVGVLLFIAAVMPDFPTLRDPRTGQEVLLNVASCWATEGEEARLSLFQRSSTMNRRGIVRELAEGGAMGVVGCGGVVSPGAIPPTRREGSRHSGWTGGGDTDTDWERMTVHRQCVRNAILSRGYSEAFSRIVTALLNFDPFQRPSASQLHDALRQLEADHYP